ncbi:SWF or SNF family helicase [Streptomyces sp. NBC_00083]|uniref:SWIM zinc finger family protein n=1 Tax=Streptomyces sp. NBC_00083 TaxID=2975647 RepID=UPI0022556522|nr:SWF or SNF family helicase [Streptomyces sp. NBC_00083]MCX5384206.1 SWF or SNF family helicase [Streptomyces sp. NBC_00083]
MSDTHKADPYEHDTYGHAARNERTFEPLPPVNGRAFATSWWGQAWLKALEDTALDRQQLKRGRRLARAGAVGAVTVRPGRITAVVRDPDGSHHRGDVLLQELDADEWDRFLAMAAERAGHIAALLDREMPPHLVEDAASEGIELLPRIGDLDPECGCEAWDHCPHTAALCYQVARLLDQDPFVLLLLRGRTERALLDALQERSGAAPAADGAATAHGVPADEAFAARDIVPPLPDPPGLPPEPGGPAHLDTETAPEPGVDPAALEFLAADTARRAHRLLADALTPGHETRPVEGELTDDQDLVRLAAGCPDSRLSARLAAASGRRPADLSAAVRAWRFGGVASLRALEEEWVPGREELARALSDLDRAWADAERPALRSAGANRWTVTGRDAQLRFGPDGRWWPYRKERGRWTPAGPADQDPAAALATVAGPDEGGTGA